MMDQKIVHFQPKDRVLKRFDVLSQHLLLVVMMDIRPLESIVGSMCRGVGGLGGKVKR
jgi:hypothetical protein